MPSILTQQSVLGRGFFTLVLKSTSFILTFPVKSMVEAGRQATAPAWAKCQRASISASLSAPCAVSQQAHLLSPESDPAVPVTGRGCCVWAFGSFRDQPTHGWSFRDRPTHGWACSSKGRLEIEFSPVLLLRFAASSVFLFCFVLCPMLWWNPEPNARHWATIPNPILNSFILKQASELSRLYQTCSPLASASQVSGLQVGFTMPSISLVLFFSGGQYLTEIQLLPFV